MKSRRIAFVVAILALSSARGFGDPRVIVQVGHSGPVTTLAYDAQSNILFSGGSDGTVVGWNAAGGDEVCALQIGHSPILLLAANQSAGQIAAVDGDESGTFRISVWDWKNNRLLFTHPLAEQPLFLAYSPAGTYLIYSVTEWRSLYFLDAHTGQELPLFGDGFGIVSAALISASERTLLTYNPAGEIDYWSLPSSTLKQSFHTTAELDEVGFTSNNRYMAGVGNDELDVVDLLTGDLAASAPLAGLRNVAVDPSTGNIVCLATTPGSNGAPASDDLSLWSLSNALYRQNGAFVTPDAHASNLLFANGALFAALVNGTVYEEHPNMNGQTLGAPSLVPADDIAVHGGMLVVSSAASYATLALGQGAAGPLPEGGTIDVEWAENPFNAPTGIAALDDGRFVAWPKNRPSGGIDLLNVVNGSDGVTVADSSQQPPASGIIGASSLGERLTALTSSGLCTVLDFSGGSPLSYAAAGIKSVASVDQNRIVTGSVRSVATNSALEQVDLRTGETVPIPCDDTEVLSLAYSRAINVLYALGVQNSGGSLSTVIEGHDASSPSAGTVVASFPGVDAQATLAIDPANGDVYSTIGYLGIRKFSYGGQGSILFERADHLPKKIVVADRWIIALNTDSSLTFWDKTTGKRLVDLYLFSDTGWTALYDDGKFAASGGAERHLRVYDGASAVADPGPFRANQSAPSAASGMGSP